MPTLLIQCKRYFNSDDLYQVLKINKKANEKEVKKAYHKLSLLVHPDRVSEEDKLEATEKFKVLGQVHAVLSDKGKRAAYDETGTVDDEEDSLAEKNWTDYWRMLFKEITIEDIKNYEKEYIGSDVERNDLKKAYLEGKGDLDYICDHVQFARSEHEPRLIETVKKMIEDGEVPAYKIFTDEPERKRKRRHAKEKREAKEVEEIEKQEQEEKENGISDLALMIKQKQQARGEALDSFIDGLAAKYGGEGSKGTKRKAAPKAAPRASPRTSAKRRKTKK